MYTLHENIANYLPVLESCNLVFVTDNTFDFQLKKKCSIHKLYRCVVFLAEIITCCPYSAVNIPILWHKQNIKFICAFFHINVHGSPYQKKYLFFSRLVFQEKNQKSHILASVEVLWMRYEKKENYKNTYFPCTLEELCNVRSYYQNIQNLCCLD